MTDMIQYVQAGACVRSGGAPGVFGMAISCALEREDCEGAIFRSSRELLLEGSEAVGYLCLERTIDTRIGRCKGDPTFTCTSNAGSCLDESEFYPRTDDCSMLVDKSPERVQSRAFFGGCAVDEFPSPIKCYWSEADCEGSNDIQWIAAGYTKCTCEKTLTGACLSNGDYYCAVSEFGCDNESIFVPASQLPETLSCFLCEEQDESVIEMKSSQITDPGNPVPQMESQPNTQDRYPTEPPQGQPTSSPIIGPDDTAAKVPREHRYFGQDRDYLFLYIAIPTVLVLNLLMCLVLTCTCSGPKELNANGKSKDEEDLISNPTGELA